MWAAFAPRVRYSTSGEDPGTKKSSEVRGAFQWQSTNRDEDRCTEIAGPIVWAHVALLSSGLMKHYLTLALRALRSIWHSCSTSLGYFASDLRLLVLWVP